MTLNALHGPPRIVAIGVLTILASVTVSTQTPLHPPNGDGGPVFIAILSDRFKATEKIDFEIAAQNFFLSGLLADPYYQSKASEFRLVMYFKPWSSASGESLYDFEIGAGSSNCAVGWSDQTSTKLEDAVAPDTPMRKVVISKYGSSIGCAHEDWVYLTTGAVGTQVVHHEFGHLLGDLFDEWIHPANGNTPYTSVYPQINKLNCSTNLSAPYWAGLPGITNKPGCRLFKVGVIHPTDLCRMGESHHPVFCIVCYNRMNQFFQDQHTPPSPVAPTPPTNVKIVQAGFGFQPAQPQSTPPPQPQVSPIVRMLVRFNITANTLTVRRATNARGAYVPSYRALSPYVYEVSDGGKPLAVAVLPNNLFETRDYRGGSQRHGAVPVTEVDVVVQIPGETIQNVLAASRQVQLTFYRLDPSVTAPVIDPSTLQDLKAKKLAAPLASLAPDALRKSLSAPTAP